MRDLEHYVYILSNLAGTVLYTGMSRDLLGRVWQHREKVVESFTSKYNVTRLVYWEQTPDMWSAYEREKQIKSWSRKRKLDLINEFNPKWRDLYEELTAEGQ